MGIRDWKPKHWFRFVSQLVGVGLLALGLGDGWIDLLPHLDAAWLIGGGVILVALGARKRPPALPG